ncbi:MAG: hypothetical protein GX600_06020 [Dehalococcoidia bacterium]|nr:hypothetical protein [Dehalococcoidia bacterium]
MVDMTARSGVYKSGDATLSAKSHVQPCADGSGAVMPWDTLVGVRHIDADGRVSSEM